jgi:NADPH:quinone reductase-like Zn-dependent oxidoreductase
MPISGAYGEFVCLPERELVPVPSGLGAAEAVSLVLNYITAYQMLHRSAKVRPGQRVLIHAAAGGVGSALLQLGHLAGLEMYGTCSSPGASAVSDLGGFPIDYQHQDFVKEIHDLTSQGVDVVFDQKWRDLRQEAMREKDVNKRAHTFFGRAVNKVSESILVNNSSPVANYLRAHTGPKWA